MKSYSVYFFLFILLGYHPLSLASRFNYKYPQGEELAIEGSIKSKELNNYNAQNILKEAKYHIITGNLQKARILLNESSLSVNFTKAIQFRYLAIIYFIEKKYQKVIDILSTEEMKTQDVQSKVCFLKVLSQIIINRPEQAKISWKDCQSITSYYSPSDLTWMQIIVDLKTNRDKNYTEKLFKDMAIDTVDEKMLRIYLKLALYLNQQDKIIPRFKYFSVAPLENPIHRELIGLNYYRNGNIVKAYQLLENLQTANAEVFKGNLYLVQKNYPKAYAQYKLALKRKANSKNALNRLLPLSWKLNQWNEGVKYLQNIEIEDEQRIENHTLMAVFLTLLNKHEAAKEYLRKDTKQANRSESLEISQLKILNSLMLHDYNPIEDAAANSCSGKDGLSCWLLIFAHSWEDSYQKLTTDETIHQKNKDLVEELTGPGPVQEIKEEILVEQKLIEELDNNLIILK